MNPDDHSVGDKAFLLEQAARARRLARSILDSNAEQALPALAVEYEQLVAAIQDSATDPADTKPASG